MTAQECLIPKADYPGTDRIPIYLVLYDQYIYGEQGRDKTEIVGLVCFWYPFKTTDTMGYVLPNTKFYGGQKQNQDQKSFSVVLMHYLVYHFALWSMMKKIIAGAEITSIAIPFLFPVLEQTGKIDYHLHTT